MNTFWLKIAVFVAVVLSLIILVSVFLTSKPEPGVPNPKVDYVAKINEIARAGRDENLNAAPFYQKAIDVYVECGKELRNKLYSRSRPVRLSELSEKEQSILKEWVLSNSRALAQLELGTKKPYYWVVKCFPSGSYIGIQVTDSRQIRELGRAITWRAKLAAVEGNIDKAAADIVTCYRFGLHMNSKPLLTEQLGGINIRSLALRSTFKILDRTEMDHASMKTLQNQIEQLSTDQSYIPDVRAEKFSILDMIQRMFTDDGKGGGRIHMESFKPMMTMQNQQTQSLEKLQRRQTTNTAEKLYEYFDFIAQKTPWQWKKEQINPRQEIEKIMEGNAFVQEFCPPFVRILEIFARVRAETDALITTLALLRYKDNKEQLPEKLDELISAGYLKTFPNDPFSAGQLVYKRIGDDFILYGFGEDCDDDSGTRDKWGTGEQGGDQVFWPVE